MRAPWSHPAKAVEKSNFPSRADLRRFSDGKRLTLTSIAVDPDFLSAPVILGQQVWWIWARDDESGYRIIGIGPKKFVIPKPVNEPAYSSAGE